MKTKVTKKEALTAKNELLKFARNNQLIDAAINAIKNEENPEEAIREAAKQPPFGSWESYLSMTDEWINAELHDESGKTVDDSIDAVDADEVWERISEKHMAELIEVAALYE